MFGLSWLFGIFSVSEGAIVFQWLFLLFNTLQGFCLFLFFCVISKDGREEWKGLLRCNKQKRKSAYNLSTTTHSKNHTLKIKQTKGTSISYTKTAVSVNSVAEFSSIVEDSVIKDTPYKMKLPDINEKDTDSIVSNEEPAIEDPSPLHSKTELDTELPPHVMMKLQQTTSIPDKHKNKKSTSNQLSTIDFAVGGTQVPPHILHRFRGPSDSYEMFYNDLSAEDDFSQNPSGSQVLSQMTDIYTLSEEEEFGNVFFFNNN